MDTSVLPRVTSRGPAATAVMLGERAAELMIGAEDGQLIARISLVVVLVMGDQASG